MALAAAALVAGCSGRPSGADRTDAGVVSAAPDADEAIDSADAGAPVDAGAKIDAGELCDAGDSSDVGATVDVTDAGAVIALEVAANPNSVLSAIATISWTGQVTSVSIQFKGGATPAFDVSASTSPVVLPVLGLTATTAYTMQAVGIVANGGSVQSNAVALTTGALPADLPQFRATGTASGTGFTLVAMQEGNSLLVVNGSGTPVWYYRLPNGLGLRSDFQQQPDGTFTAAIPLVQDSNAREFLQVDVLGNLLRRWTATGTDGAGIVTDTNGKQIQILATNGHDIRIQPDGSAILFGWLDEVCDLSSLGGYPAARCRVDVLERVSPEGGILWAFNTAEYFTPADIDPISATLTGPDVDMTHGNAIDAMRDGNYLVSLRNLSQVVKVDSKTGKIIWRLGGAGISSPSSGGPKGDFTFVNDPEGFSCQHGVRELPNGNVILFDNGNGHVWQESRAVEYALDTAAMTATMVWESGLSRSLYTHFLGYAQRMSDGDTLVAYGDAQRLKEWNPDATAAVWTLTAAGSGTSDEFYRAFRMGSLYSYSPP